MKTAMNSPSVTLTVTPASSARWVNAWVMAKRALKQRLAIDLNLFRDGKYLTLTSDHAPLGAYWQRLGGTWGGDFNDGNHYSLAFNGIK